MAGLVSPTNLDLPGSSARVERVRYLSALISIGGVLVNSARKRLSAGDHPAKEVRKALKDILKRKKPSFELTEGGHWGTLWCSNGCCQIPVSGTPRNAQRHAMDLIREANKCPRKDGDVRKRVKRPRRR